jgi:hypothetical protein
MSEAWARFNATSYSYRFNVVVSDADLGQT